MSQIHLINYVNLVERRLEIENEQRKKHPFRPNADDWLYLQETPKPRKPLFAWLQRGRKARKPFQPCYPPANCRESRLG